MIDKMERREGCVIVIIIILRDKSFPNGKGEKQVLLGPTGNNIVVPVS
jgi:hypothetical protein